MNLAASNFRALFVSGAIAMTLLGAAALTQAGSRDMPTYDRDQTDWSDRVVARGASDIEDHAYKSGDLGVLLTSYNRSALLLAYRALQLSPDELVRQSKANASPAQEDEPKGDLKTWLQARSAYAEKPPVKPIPKYTEFGGGFYGSFVNCGDPAFVFAADTLKSLAADKKTSRGDIKDWIEAQDKVFELCDSGPKSAPPHLAELPKKKALRLRQLRQYQIAAAFFYARHFDEAAALFNAIAADTVHPMRAWAAHATNRALVRKASLEDAVFVEEREAIRNSNATIEQKRTDFLLVKARSRERSMAAYQQIAARIDAMLSDPNLATVHTAAVNLKKQAAIYLSPRMVYAERTARIDRFDADFDVTGELYDWWTMGNDLFDYGDNLDLVDELRKQYEYFDWIRTIQGCSDAHDSPNNLGKCDAEHEHARQRWAEAKKPVWLAATLMTASSYQPTLDAVFASAKTVTAKETAYLTLRYHMIRLLRKAGKRNDALALLQSTNTDSSSISAKNLFDQERLSLATNDSQLVKSVLRNYHGAVPPLVSFAGADGDEFLNRRMSTADLWRLAQNAEAPEGLRNQLLVASWWRADMVGNAVIAKAAAQRVGAALPALRGNTDAYLAAKSTDEQHFLLAKAALEVRISPQVGFVSSRDFARRPRTAMPDWWCSFDSQDHLHSLAAQRISSDWPAVAVNAAQLKQEQALLAKIGTAADWLAHIALGRAKTQPKEEAVRTMLRAVILSEKLECIGPESDSLVGEAKFALANLLGSNPVTDDAIRTHYDKMVNERKGQQEFQVAHILVAHESEATAILTELANGASFEDLARQRSIDKGSGALGGWLGWSVASIFPSELSRAVRATSRPGLYSKPVHTSFGWHVIRVEAARDYQPPPFQEARKTIEAQLLKEATSH